MIVFAAIAPHGEIAMEESDGSPTRAGMDELARRFAAARPEVTIVFTPHNAHVEGSFAVVTAARIEGTLAALDRPDLVLDCPVDRDLALAVRDAIRADGLPVVGVSFGGNMVEQSAMPIDWGVFVPVWFMGGRGEPQTPVVVVSPARDRPIDEHVNVGAAVARATGDRRVAVIASCDHGHAHSAEGPYGYDQAAAEFDERVVEVVRSDRLDQLLDLDPEFVERAAADSWWQMVMLHGALGDAFAAEFLTYEVKRYYGMLCAAYRPRR